MPELGNIKAIKQYLEEGPHGRQVTLQELKVCSPEERAELGELCRQELA